MTIGFLGINSKSLSYGILFEKVNHTCIFYDENEDKVFNLNHRFIPETEIEINVELSNSKKISGFTDVTEVIKNSEIIFHFIDCPSNADNTIDISKIFGVLQFFYLSSNLDISLFEKKFILSTVLNPGDSKIIFEKISQFGLLYGYLPNFLTEENIYSSLQNNEFTILGTNSTELSTIISNLLRQIKNKNSEILIMSPESAELVKFGISTIVSNKIVVSNIIGDFMTTMGLEKEIPLVLNSISKDKRIGNQNLNYGLGFGGPHLGKELRAFAEFAKSKKIEINIFEEINRANDEHTTYLKYYYMTLNPDKNIPFILDRITYKIGSDIIEDSQRFKLCLELLNEGYYVNVLENTNISNKFLELAENFQNKLKFFKRGTNPEGVKIRL